MQAIIVAVGLFASVFVSVLVGYLTGTIRTRRFGLKEAMAAAMYIYDEASAKAVKKTVFHVLWLRNTIAEDLERFMKKMSAANKKALKQIELNKGKIEALNEQSVSLRWEIEGREARVGEACRAAALFR